MPIYAFECTACGHSFERLQRLSDPDPANCPSCDRTSLRRQLTAPAFRLSGSGWYETDFKGKDEKKRNLSGAGSEVKPGQDAGKPASDKSEVAKPDAAKSGTGKPDTGAAVPASDVAKPAAIG